MRLARMLSGLVLVIGLTGGACNSEGPTAIEIPIAKVEIVAACTSVIVGSQCPFRAVATTAEGQIITNPVLRWSSNSAAARVDEDGRVTGVAPGSADITVANSTFSTFDTTTIIVLLARPK
ncbi:MAG: Ig-like domain-containing protein [Gemmatimonadota bacterium]